MLQQERLPEKQEGPSFFGKLLRKMDGCDVKFQFTDKAEEDRVSVDDLYNKKNEKLHLYESHEPVRGKVYLVPPNGSYSHSGVLIEMVGVVKIVGTDEKLEEFVSRSRKYEADTVNALTGYDFDFDVVKPHESYRGINASVSYYIRATVVRPIKNITEKREFWVTKVDEEQSESQPDASAHPSYFRETTFGPQSVVMDVGVEDRLHIEFRYDKDVFHLQERVLGKVTFKMVDLDIQFGEVSVVRKELIGAGNLNDDFEIETLQKFEIMDGTSIVGEVVPIRLYLYSIPRLTPSYINVADKFSVRYYLNLVLVTANGKRYFKRQEITLYRRRGQERLTANMDLPAARMNVNVNPNPNGGVPASVSRAGADTTAAAHAVTYEGV